MTGVVVWPYPIRVVAERIPEEDRPGYIALRWVRPNPVRRVLAQFRYKTGGYDVTTLAPRVAETPTPIQLFWGEEDDKKLVALVAAPIDGGPASLILGQVLRLASDRKYPYDPAKEAEDLLATLITGTGAVPVADRLLASLDP